MPWLRNKRTYLLLIPLVVAVATIWVLTRPDADPYPEGPTQAYAGSWATEYESLAQFVADADLVVIGEVTGVVQGETSTSESGAEETARLLEVDLGEVVYNRVPAAAGETVQVHDGFWSDGDGYVRDDLPWLESGDRAIFILQFNEDSDTYSYPGTEARVVLSGETPVLSGGEHSELWAAAGIDPATADEAAYRAALEEAAELARTGAVAPVNTVVCEPAFEGDEEGICVGDEDV